MKSRRGHLASFRFGLCAMRAAAHATVHSKRGDGAPINGRVVRFGRHRTAVRARFQVKSDAAAGPTLETEWKTEANGNMITSTRYLFQGSAPRRDVPGGVPLR